MRSYFDKRVISLLLLAFVFGTATSAVAVHGHGWAQLAALAPDDWLRLGLGPAVSVAFALALVAVYGHTLRVADTRLREVLASDVFPDKGVATSATPAGFARDLESFTSLIVERCEQLSYEQQDNFARNKLVGYQKRCAESSLEALPDAIVLMDGTGSATFANQKTESLLGIPVDQIVGHKPHEWCEVAELIGLLGRYHSNVTRLRRSDTLEFTPGTGDGRRVTAHAIPLPAIGGGVATLVVFRDTTRFAELQRARDEFIAHVSHELKSPLNVIRMHGELLGASLPGDNGEAVAALNVIDDEVQRLARLIDDLLNLTRMEAGTLVVDRERVKLTPFLEDVFETARRQAESRGITLQLQLPSRLPTVSLDKDLFRIALNNLLGNAVKYNCEQGKITLYAQDNDDSVVVGVSDTGIGIRPEDQEHVFDKFYRSRDSEAQGRGGHGLGLCLAREIVALHSGRLQLESVFGEGTTFSIELRKTAHLLQEAV